MSLTIFIFAVVAFIAFTIYKANQNTKDVTINTVSISQLKPNLSQENFTVLHLSDLHLENISIAPHELYEMISKQPVDMIALTGDFLDRKRSIPKLIPYLKILKKVNPSYGIYAVFGNHDYVLREKHFKHLKNTMKENGIVTLQNEHITLDINGNKVNIIGIDDHSTQRSNIVKSYKGLPAGYNLILTHDPNIVLDLHNVPFDYLLSGHFHGGQIHWPRPYHLFKMGKLVQMKMIKGLHYYKGKPFYISEGLGQTGVNIRIGSRPEITFHEI
ncbi:metallophosphoesterase [Bacillus chungangensis]|uniref:MPP superfamily phosphohydrolase n=1 Tax=Bacillus chungangensis TaxID=587633 RepID=A0ABT9WQE6_9BACI|nr:metallophosphoesterase [Bacillus chungangensis]MDQ0175469.1 putative MPP superfamily phosphohydrolase [Bacillus chungangensis]